MEVPELYAYIYRNSLKIANGRKVVKSEVIFKAIRTTVWRTSNYTYRKVIKEMEGFGFIKQLNTTDFMIFENGQLKSKIKKLKSYVFPIDV